MNLRLIVFSGVITSVVGVGVGLLLANLFPTPYQGGFYEHMNRKYMAIGGVSGLLIGMSQEALRQLKKQRDEEEKN